MKRKSTLSLSLSLFLSSFSLFFLPPYPSIHFLHLSLLSDDLFSSQSNSLSIYMKKENIHLSLSLSLSLSFTSIPSLSSFSLPTLQTFYLMKTFLSDDLFSSQSDSLSIYMKRRKSKRKKRKKISLFYNVHSFSLFFLLPTLQYIPSLIIS
ncbi:unnamed protein product [Acanthosepion pharaonis]|uniref:Uncharacterized protein n=1 Tax=Acanthosepion pharaonis TaxID=158019 RepID=A0A812EHZ8_ACAPH|nr:unnamed protein product [Sepia pharaonis]